MDPIERIQAGMASQVNSSQKDEAVQKQETRTVDMHQKGTAPTTDEAFEFSGLKLTKREVKDAQKEIGARTSAGTKNKVIAMHDNYAQAIAETCKNAPAEYRALAQNFIKELPKASRKRDLQEYKAACEAKLDAFRANAQRYGLGKYMEGLHLQSEFNSDLRAASIGQKVDNLSQQSAVQHNETMQGINELKEGQQQISNQINQRAKEINGNVNRGIGRLSRQVAGAESRIKNTTVNVGEGVKRHVTKETNRAIDTTLQDMKAISGIGNAMGVLSDGTIIGEDNLANRIHNEHEKTRGEIRSAKKDIISGVNDHTDQVAQEAKLDRQQKAVLERKSKHLHSMLHHEEHNGPGRLDGDVYRDGTINWFGNMDARVMADNELTYEQRVAAYNDLIKMADGELWVSDTDKAKFENKYFRDHRDHSHIDS